ncbi:hypothetical protein ACLOJK_005670 [Asimina triloba]
MGSHSHRITAVHPDLPRYGRWRSFPCACALKYRFAEASGTTTVTTSTPSSNRVYHMHNEFGPSDPFVIFPLVGNYGPILRSAGEMNHSTSDFRTRVKKRFYTPLRTRVDMRVSILKARKWKQYPTRVYKYGANPFLEIAFPTIQLTNESNFRHRDGGEGEGEANKNNGFYHVRGSFLLAPAYRG